MHDSQLEQAWQWHQNGRLAEAEQGYRAVLQRVPDHGLAWRLLGFACHGLGNVEGAIQALRQAVRSLPDNENLEGLNALGMLLGQWGVFDEATDCFERILKVQPDSLDTYKNLSVTHERAGRLDEAVACDRKVIELNPQLVQAHRHLGSLLRKQERWDEAISALEQALRIQPNLTDTLNDLALLLEMTDRLEESLARYQAALQLRPDFADAYSNMTAVLRRLDRLDEAVAAGRRAVQIAPESASAHSNLGVVLEEEGDWDEAVACHQAAIRLDPGFSEAYENLASVLSRLGRFDEADQACRQALALNPNSYGGHHNLAFALSERGWLNEAEAHYRRAIELKPDAPDPYVNLTSLLGKFGRLDEAEACSRTAIRLDPKRSEAYVNLGFVLVEKGLIAEALQTYREAEILDPRSRPVQSSYLYGLNYDPDATPSFLLAEHRRWGEQVERETQPLTPPSAPTAGHPRPLRVGYVSADFRKHPVAFFLRDALTHHDRNAFEPYCYSDVTAPDDMTRQLEERSHVWRPVFGLTDEKVAELVRQDQIDILVDLGGHTARHRLGLFALRPAPIQVTYLGYPNTTGLTTIDYILTDPIVDPPNQPAWSTETPYHLPTVFSCFSPPESAPLVSPLPALRNRVMTFGSLHKLSKLNALVVETWAKLLQSVPNSRLLLYRNNLEGRRRHELLDAFLTKGINPARLDFRNTLSGEGGHYQVYHEIDVSLDVFPWSGHTTACESLWMGVPILTLRGDRHAGRMTASVLNSLNLNEWIAESLEDYLARAQSLPNHLDELSALRQSLRERMTASPLRDGAGWTRDLEEAYRLMKDKKHKNQ